jgi:hypothetical protein
VPRSFVVDAHNALHRLGRAVPDSAEGQRRALLKAVRPVVVSRRGGATGDRVHLVFDAAPGGRHAGTHGRDGSVSWSYAVGSADEAIAGLVREHGGAHAGLPIVVVTDDRELAGRVSQLGAATLGVRDWLSLAPDDDVEEPRRPAGGPPFTAKDFGLPEGPIPLD